MQILHPFAGSVQQYLDQLDDPNQHRPTHCPQCQAKRPLTAHGFYTRTIIDSTFDGPIPVRRYLCEACCRTVSLLPEFALPYLRSSITVIALFLVARLLKAKTLAASLPTLTLPARPVLAAPFPAQAEALCVALAALTQPLPAPDFIHRALTMLESSGWIPAHRFLFTGLRQHLLGWPRSLVPDGRRASLRPVSSPV